jgi:hypothetical protein
MSETLVLVYLLTQLCQHVIFKAQWFESNCVSSLWPCGSTFLLAFRRTECSSCCCGGWRSLWISDWRALCLSLCWLGSVVCRHEWKWRIIFVYNQIIFLCSWVWQLQALFVGLSALVASMSIPSLTGSSLAVEHTSFLRFLSSFTIQLVCICLSNSHFFSCSGVTEHTTGRMFWSHWCKWRYICNFSCTIILTSFYIWQF